MNKKLIMRSIPWAAALALSLCLAACGGSSNSSSSSGSNPPPSGPASGSEFFYEFSSDQDVMVSTLDTKTGAMSAFTDAAPNLYPVLETQGSDAAVATPSGKFLYVTGFDQLNAKSAIYAFSISGPHGELTSLAQPPFTAPYNNEGMVMDSLGRFLYISYSGLKNQIPFNAIQEYSINQTTGFPQVGPVFVETAQAGEVIAQTTDLSGKYLFAWGETTKGVDIFIYAIDQTSGALTEVAGSPFSVIADEVGAYYQVGFSQIFRSPTSENLYWNLLASDPNTVLNEVLGFSIDTQTGALSPISGSPFLLGQEFSYPTSILPNGKYLFAVTRQSTPNGPVDSLSSFAVDPIGGAINTAPTAAYSGSFGVANIPDPSGSFLISSFVPPYDEEVCSFNIDPFTGALTPVSGSPFFTAQSYNLTNTLVVKIP